MPGGRQSQPTVIRPRRSVLSPAVRVYILVAALAAAAALVWTALIGAGDPFARPIDTSWWVIAGLVVASESAVVHIRFGRDAQTFSLTEFVLVFGMFMASPTALLVGLMMGSVASLTLVRRQKTIKILFNLAQLALVDGLALVLLRAIVDMADPIGPLGWLAALVAAVATLLLGEALVMTVIRLSGGTLDRAHIIESVAVGSAGAAISASLGYVAVFVVWFDSHITWLGFLPPVIMYSAYSGYARMREQRRRLESIRAITDAIHAPSEVATGLVDACERARDLVAASWLEIVVTDEVDGPVAYRTIVSYDGERSALDLRDAAVRLPDWWSEVVEHRRSIIVDHATTSLVAGSEPITSQAMVVPVIGSERVHGYVLAADPLADISRFAETDLQMLETVATLVSVWLDNGRIAASLARMTAANDQLEDFIRAKDRFIATISHELRTPLTAVMGLAAELEERFDKLAETDVKEFIAVIADQSNELANLVEDLLVAARADLGTLVVAAEQVDVLAELAGVTDTSGHKPQSVSVMADATPQLWVDPLRFRQIIRNLLTNAKRYGGGSVTIDVTDEDDHVAVAVVDDGNGVPEENVARIFDPYERGELTPSQPGSLGLGLSVARDLARLMGGDLTYGRSDGLTRFTLQVPKPKTAGESSPAATSATEPGR